ncbi:Uncharacterised protein [Dermatophilus congolensis]|uniref:Uncharacterized protein n=1 Tax=Dermatophilus congolensis TaxID=1863 RepID=A0AA46BLA1_9MICO|nr:Uncharacterised protein [Dermatophilus congolensis]
MDVDAVPGACGGEGAGGDVLCVEVGVVAGVHGVRLGGMSGGGLGGVVLANLLLVGRGLGCVA